MGPGVPKHGAYLCCYCVDTNGHTVPPLAPYTNRFVDDYLRMVYACAQRDRRGVIDMSVSLGFLTGDESAVMLDAHTEAGFVVGLPFATEGEKTQAAVTVARKHIHNTPHI